MECPKCHTHLPDQARYCFLCGARVTSEPENGDALHPRFIRQFFEVVAAGDIDTVEEMIRDTPALLRAQSKDKRRYTALHVAAESKSGNSLEMAELLIDYGADIRAQTDGGTEPIHCALDEALLFDWQTHLPMVRLLYSCGARFTNATVSAVDVLAPIFTGLPVDIDARMLVGNTVLLTGHWEASELNSPDHKGRFLLDEVLTYKARLEAREAKQDKGVVLETTDGRVIEIPLSAEIFAQRTSRPDYVTQVHIDAIDRVIEKLREYGAKTAADLR